MEKENFSDEITFELNALTEQIIDSAKWQKRWLDFFQNARTTLKVLKIITNTAMATTAIITALSLNQLAATVTAIIGVFSTLIMVYESEISYEQKRRHHTNYWIKFEKFNSDLHHEKEINHDILEEYRNKYFELRMAERNENFEFEV